MEQNVIREEPKQLPPVKTPRLTLKILHGIIGELRDENVKLAARVEELERQWQEYDQIRQEAAVAAERAVAEQQQQSNETEKGLHCDVPQSIRLSRAERRPATKKKSIWTLWSRPRSP